MNTFNPEVHPTVGVNYDDTPNRTRLVFETRGIVNDYGTERLSREFDINWSILLQHQFDDIVTFLDDNLVFHYALPHESTALTYTWTNKTVTLPASSNIYSLTVTIGQV